MLGEKIPQLSLMFGADDLDGTIQEENITYSAGSKKRGLEEKFLERLIEDAGYLPVERDTIYNVLASRNAS